jgi:hypothetical protein
LLFRLLKFFVYVYRYNFIVDWLVYVYFNVMHQGRKISYEFVQRYLKTKGLNVPFHTYVEVRIMSLVKRLMDTQIYLNYPTIVRKTNTKKSKSMVCLLT